MEIRQRLEHRPQDPPNGLGLERLRARQRFDRATLPEIRDAVAAMSSSPFHPALRRLHHWSPFYEEAKRLEGAKALVRIQRDRRVFYKPHRAIKRALKRALASIPSAA